MAVFIIKGKKSLGTLTREAEGIVIGTRSSCTIPLEDPLCAEEHASVRWENDRFMIEDLGSSSGTYLNGLAITGRTPLTPAAEVVIGVSRFKVEIDLEKKQLTLTVKEKEFFYDKKEDPLNWVRTEVSFGKFPLLRYANWIAILVFAGSLPLFFLETPGDTLLEPGKLCPAHHEASRDSRSANAKGCESCHDPGNGTPVEKCASCHSDLMQNQHPFGQWEKQDCVRCHTEHRGNQFGLTTLRKAADTCLECHGEKQTMRQVAKLQLEEHGIVYNTFSHADHVEKQGIACNQCHALTNTTGPVAANPSARDFVPVDFNGCMKCHAQDAKTEIRSRKTFQVDWHGTDQGKENCLQCHAQLHQKELKSSPHEPVEIQFATRSRFHSDEFLKHPTGSSDACIDCHRDGVAGQNTEKLRPFLHGTHLKQLTPNASVNNQMLSQDCASCHQEQKAALALAQPAYSGPTGDCAACHRNPDGAALPMHAKPVKVEKPARNSRTQFPHHLHLNTQNPKLKEGCFSCHEFSSTDTLQARPMTKPEASSCLSCHSGHQEISGGSCLECHQANDPVYSQKAIPIKRPAQTGFDHRSPGHAPMTNKGDCLSCHDNSTRSAKTIADLQLPDESQQSCRDCHIQQKARFHWR